MEYTSCNWLIHGLNFEPEHLEMCCLRCHEGGGNVIFKTGYNGETINWDELHELKKKFVEDNKKGIIDPRCEGCFNLQHKHWDDEKFYFNYIHFNHWTHCNCKCTYCFTDYAKDYFNSKSHYSVLPIIKDMFEHKLFKPGGEITFAGGEPTILEEFEDLINFLLDNDVHNITIHTSGIKFSQGIQRGVSEGKINVVVSLDSGFAPTYEKIKIYQHFDKVWENTKKYAQVQSEDDRRFVSTKFIFVPGVNDTQEEIESWLNLNIQNGVRSIVVDVEHEWFKIQRESKIMPQHIMLQLQHIIETAETNEMKIVLYNSARYLIQNQKGFSFV